MWNASGSRQAGRILGGLSPIPDPEGWRDVVGAGVHALEGKELSDAEKWQLAYKGGRVGAYWMGGKIAKGLMKK